MTGPAGPWKHHFASVDGVRLHYVRQGSGSPVLLLHGWPGFWYEWAPVIPPLAAGHDVIVPDLRGFAYSDKPDVQPEQGYARDAVAQEVAAFVRQLRLAGVAVVAHDIGATVAQPLARLYPDLVARLVLLDPPYPGIGRRWREPGHPPEIWYQIFHTLPWAHELVGVSCEATRIYLRHFLTLGSGKMEWVTDAELVQWVDAYSQPDALRGGFAYYKAFERVRTSQADVAPEKLRITQPTLVLWGDADSILPVAWADRLPEYFAALSLKRVPGVGHFMMREAPEVLAKEVLAFLAS
jgi:pimeloyl-ACP methyl ester carboxylesterase